MTRSGSSHPRTGTDNRWSTRRCQHRNEKCNSRTPNLPWPYTPTHTSPAHNAKTMNTPHKPRPHPSNNPPNSETHSPPPIRTDLQQGRSSQHRTSPHTPCIPWHTYQERTNSARTAHTPIRWNSIQNRSRNYSPPPTTRMILAPRAKGTRHTWNRQTACNPRPRIHPDRPRRRSTPRRAHSAYRNRPSTYTRTRPLSNKTTPRTTEERTQCTTRPPLRCTRRRMSRVRTPNGKSIARNYPPGSDRSRHCTQIHSPLQSN